MANNVIIRNLAVLVKDFLRPERNFSLWNESAGVSGLVCSPGFMVKIDNSGGGEFSGLTRRDSAKTGNFPHLAVGLWKIPPRIPERDFRVVFTFSA